MFRVSSLTYRVWLKCLGSQGLTLGHYRAVGHWVEGSNLSGTTVGFWVRDARFRARRQRFQDLGRGDAHRRRKASFVQAWKPLHKKYIDCMLQALACRVRDLSAD